MLKTALGTIGAGVGAIIPRLPSALGTIGAGVGDGSTAIVTIIGIGMIAATSIETTIGVK